MNIHRTNELLRTATEKCINEERHVKWLKDSSMYRYKSIHTDKKVKTLNIRELI